jgi:aconitate hydratase
MTLLQFMLAGLPSVAVPTTVHCDHLIQARAGAKPDVKVALDANREIYEFLRTAAAKYGIGFWEPGSGIIHQVVLENYAFPGGMMIGTDSHTPNAGGVGMVAIGVGGADAVDVLAGRSYNTRVPKLIGVRLVGELSGWAAPKDVILTVAGILTVNGGTGAIVEYFGPGARSISATGRATICNMGAEVGATCSLFAYDEQTASYLRASGRRAIADLADRYAEQLRNDPEVDANAARYYDRVIDIDLSQLEPRLVGPHTPDHDRPVSQIATEAREHGYPATVSAALVGSCTNSSYEDIGRAAHIARQARAAGMTVRAPLLIAPGSEQVRATIERDGLLADLEAIGATVLANACGPCIGQWKRDGAATEPNTIVTSFNRNFPARNDGNAQTYAFIGSPETVVGMALTGRLSGDFVDVFDPPVADDLPAAGFDAGASGFVAPPDNGSTVDVAVAPDSERIQLLQPFPAWDGNDILGLRVLVKAVGKCTTDHISPAGRWLRYRGHLENISGNLYAGVRNAFDAGRPLAERAREWKDAGIAWIAVGDDNFGEGSSREHAAMEPRFMGGRVALARSFPRLYEANLKKQGVLTLTFADGDDYDRIREDDHVDVTGLSELEPGSAVVIVLHHADGTTEEFVALHTMSEEQIEWFRAGSALNLLASRR